MTVGIIFYLEEETASLFNHDPQAWRNVITKSNLDFYIMIDEHNLQPNWIDDTIESYKVNTLSEALDVKPTHDKVFVDENGTTLIKDYTHSDNTIYVFGKDNGGFGSYDLTDKTTVKLPFTGNVWSLMALSCVMCDRL